MVGEKMEDAPAISLWLAALPETNIKLFHLEFERAAEGGIFTGWPADLAAEWPRSTAMLLLGEPFSFPADELLRRMNEDRPGVPVLGGMASGGGAPGENRVVLGREVYEQGAVAVLVDGKVRVWSVVSQGCRPIGQTYVITKAERNLIHELGGMPTLHRLQEVHATLVGGGAADVAQWAACRAGAERVSRQVFARRFFDSQRDWGRSEDRRGSGGRLHASRADGAVSFAR